MPGDYDEILLGGPVATGHGDSDGDGVSDTQERLDDTNPADPSDFLAPRGPATKDSKETRDFDGDGVPDLQELSEGTDADDASDYLGAPVHDPKTKRDGESSAVTAVSADDTSAPGISSIGSGGGSGIQSTATGSDEVMDLVAGIRDPSVRPVNDMGAQRGAPDAGAAAVDTFATEYLRDASLDAPAPDFVAAGLTADLGADLVPVPDDFDSRSQDDLGAESPDEFATLGRDDDLDA